MNIRTRLRSAPLAALAFGLLCFVTAFTTTALPRVVDAYGTAALQDVLASVPPQSRSVTGTFPVEPRLGPDGEVTAPAVRPAKVDEVGRVFAESARGLPTDPADAVAGVANTAPVPAPGPDLPRLTPRKAPEATLAAQRGLAGHSRLVRGEMPGPEVTFEQTGAGAEADFTQHVEAVVTERTSGRMGLEPGDTFRLGLRYATVVTVTGVVEARDPDDFFWRAEPALGHPEQVSQASKTPGAPPERYWHFGALLHRAAAHALPNLESGAEVYWRLPLDTDGLRAHQVPALLGGLSALDRGPGGAALAEAADGPVTIEGGLDALLGDFASERSAVAPLLAMTAAGVTTAALTVLALWGILAAERRRDELDLLRARGASVPGLAGRLLAETAATGLPAAAAGCGLALWLVPDARTGPALLLAAAVTAVALLTLPVRAALVHRRPLAQVSRSDGPGGPGTRRRIVAEATVLVLVAGAVAALRQRGTADAAIPDPLAAAAPVLLSVAAALLLLRCYPLPLRLLSRPASRSRGAVAFLGLARAGRAPSAAVTGLPLLSLLLALTVASFGGTVLAGVADARDRAALLAVGADARVASPANLSGTLRSQIREAPGVRHVSSLHTYEETSVLGRAQQPVLAVVDPASYARLAARTGLGAYPAEALEGRKGGKGEQDGTVPALVSPDLTAPDLTGRTGGVLDVLAPGLQISVRPELVRESTPAAPQGTFVVVSRSALERAQPGTAGTALVRPNTLLLGGADLDTEALRALTGGAGSGPALNLRSEERASYSGSVLVSGAERLYLAAVLAAAALSALAVALSLVQTAPERNSLLARLRTLGMPRRQGRWLILVETLPLYVLTAAAGVSVALASVPLLGPGLDLTALAGTPDTVPARLDADLLSLILPALCLLVLTGAALLLQARAAARRTNLRMESS